MASICVCVCHESLARNTVASSPSRIIDRFSFFSRVRVALTNTITFSAASSYSRRIWFRFLIFA